MDSYREFWSNLIIGNDSFFPTKPERFWEALAVFALICLVVGILSLRARLLAPGATLAIFALYVTAIVPFMFWTAQCPGCGASFSYDSARSFELVLIQMAWGGFFATGAAALWIGVLLGRGGEWLAQRYGPRAA